MNRREFFKLCAGGKSKEGTPQLPEAVEEGFFETLYECEDCAKAMKARLPPAGQAGTQGEQYPEQCPIHGQ